MPPNFGQKEDRLAANFPELRASEVRGVSGTGTLPQGFVGREEHCFGTRAACLVAASDSWPLIDLAPSAGSRSGPQSDPLGARRRMHESFSGSLRGPHGRVAARTAKRPMGSPDDLGELYV